MTEENGSLSRLPIGWVWTEMQHTSETTSGGTPTRSKKEYFGGNIPWLKSGELNNQVINSSEESITREGLENSSAKIVPKGALLIALYGATVGKLGILGIDAAINQAICAILPYEGISCKFLFWYLRQHRNELLNIRKGGAQPNISQDVVKHIPVPIAPFDEQKRIVARLEELFTRLDAGVEGLRKVKAQLKRYRQAILKYAFEGKLTEEWRKTHKHETEPATKQLERIRQERRKSGQEAFVENQRQSSFTDLPELPETWVWTTMGELIIDARYGTSKKCHSEPNGAPVLRIPNIVKGGLDFHDLKYTHLSAEEAERLSIRSGDILVIRTNGSLDLVGRASTIGEHQDNYAFASYLIRLRPVVTETLPRYLTLVLSSHIGRKTIEGRARTTAGQFNVNLVALRSIPVPLPPFAEQNEVAESIGRDFSFIDETEKAVIQSIELAEHLRQSILKIAFEGRLVPQDPNDEPADRLLERTRLERTKSMGKKDTNKGRKNKPKQLELSTYVK